MNRRRGYRPGRLGSLTVDPIASQPMPPIGLVAGWGNFPVHVARALVRAGHGVVCVAIKDHAGRELESICDHVVWSGVGRLGGHLRYFRRRGVTQVAMAGKLFKSDLLFSGSLVMRHFPDWTCVRTFGPLLLGPRRDARDDSLLLAVTAAYTRAGIRVCPATDFAPDLLVEKGDLVGRTKRDRVWDDIRAGWRVAKSMGAMDIGQSITVKDGAVIAVEAIEGTDACIRRTGDLCRRGGWTLVKVSKPDQDMRFDVPTIGRQTIETVRAAGGIAIAVEANKTILVDRDETLAAAKAAGIRIVAVDEADLAEPETVPRRAA